MKIIESIMNLPKNFFSDLLLFLKAFIFYSKNFPVRLILATIKALHLVVTLVGWLKFEVIRRLIWSRGRRSRPAIHLGLTALIAFVLIFGGPLSGSTVVRTRIEDTGGDFLEAEIDVLAAETDVLTSSTGNRGRQEPYVYVVKPGDTLASVGEKFNVSVNAIRYASNLTSSDYLKIGQELTIPPVGGLWHTIGEGDTVSSLATKFEVAEQAIIDSNYLFPPYTLSVGQQLIVPDAKIPAPVTVKSPTISQYASTAVKQVVSRITGDTVGTGTLSCPATNFLISQYFSSYHPAIDIPSVGQSSLNIVAADSGTVTAVYTGGWNYGYGNQVIIDHGNGYITSYSHLSAVNVAAGINVTKGELIGIMGNTGRSFGTHLHFEVEYFGKLVNPLTVL